MTHERHPSPDSWEGFWQRDLLIGDGVIQGVPYSLRLKLHHAIERQRSAQELVPIAHPSPRLYFLAHTYILQPEIRITVGVYPAPTPAGEIGRVQDASWEGMRPTQIGSAQAWYYPAERTLIFWECLLHGWCRHQDPAQDETLKTL